MDNNSELDYKALDEYTCPNCGEMPLDGEGCSYADKYCPNCGQALDWGDKG